MKKIAFVVTMIAVVTLVSITSAFAAYKYFKDVEDNVWYTDAINNLSTKGIVKGYEDGTFKPGQGVSRAEVAVMLNNTISYLETGSVVQADADKEYKNTDLAFAFSYPSGMTMEKTAYNEQALASYQLSNANAPVWEADEGGPAAVSVSVFDNSEGLTALEWATANNNSNFNFDVDYSVIAMGGLEGVMYNFEGLGSFNYKVVGYDGKIYKFGYFYMTSDPVVSDAFEKITNTLKFL